MNTHNACFILLHPLHIHTHKRDPSLAEGALGGMGHRSLGVLCSLLKEYGYTAVGEMGAMREFKAQKGMMD